MVDKSGIGTMVMEQHEMITDALDLFSLPAIERAQISGREQIFYPVGGSLNENGPWEIIVPNESHEYIQTNSISLHGVVRVSKAANANIVEADKISIVNNMPQALFSQINVYLNGVVVNDQANSQYHYKSFLENHFSYGKSIKETTLKALEKYEKDVVDKEEDFGADSGLTKRKAWIQDGKKIHFAMKIHNDFLQCSKYLLPGVEIKIELKKNDPGFPIIAENENAATFVLEKLELRLQKITVEPEFIAKVESALDSMPAMYPIAHSKIRNYLLAANTKNIHIPNILRGRLPRGFIILMVGNDAHSGSIKKNPYAFKHYSLNFINAYINGEPLHPNGNKPTWDDGSAIEQYKNMLDNTGLKTFVSNGISFEEFVSNSVCFAYDLTPDKCNSYQSHGSETGNVDIQLGFKTALTEPVQIIVYATYDEVVTINKERVVTVVSASN